ncbi:Carnitine acetyltransferase [Komagataella phaffii CBS 7435]|uniref:Carnitine O-acetyltransferase, mitochondrial n=2 Tax=Komagataella phaffii TaxID=460519 RepID=C4R3G3_KOMPG|nr:uncharacterized protein PAS_chr3_0069 [Komagataella phaffii GS115]AOA64218.1 GQ67_03080T0 [Komagataella phaffii]CAH2450283.1 Carnitine acetyltransferase [Komagataella phaffii CBS 7435]AOA68991.1 GQ68_03064T0 [Komagataella phaffii GS115]CAY69998.1 Carnitine acetyl-CoA transferase present in both mitochondria and peroxisomes, transfers activated a [Komagataella phaffii GS115]CCA40114.1 Carnitine acetyltransferase [Komagataella phaffii CBS 7435]
MSAPLLFKRSFSMSLRRQAGQLYKYQDSLPNLPVPELSQTVELYKRSLIPLYPEGETDPNFLRYSKVIDDFFKTDGPKLQERLQTLAKSERNWLAKYWDNVAYLDYRDPVSPFVSYFFNHKDHRNIPFRGDQLKKAAALTREVVLFAQAVHEESLAPEVIKPRVGAANQTPTAFCMESFRWMFNNGRVPGAPSDTNIQYDPSKNSYVTVISHGNFYVLNHHDSQGNPLSEADLYQQLTEIKKHSLVNKQGEIAPVGVLTSSNRDVWYNNYSELIQSPLNKNNIELINASTFVLALDSDSPVTIEEKSRRSWHGNGANRWFDKPVQMFVAENGSSGFLGEHSKMDGTPTLGLNDYVNKKLKSETYSFETASTSDKQWKFLNWDITPATQTAIKQELATFDQTVNSLDIRVWQYPGLGKSLIKKFKLSPDAFIQMLIQLAYYKMTGISRPTYESASTRKFFRGRTETCRSVSKESLEYVKKWQDANVSDAEKVAAFRNAVSSHLNYITKASNGQGCDRHLFGLKQQYQSGETVHELFTDPICAYSQHWFLSTSQLSSEEFNGYGWSPVVPDGYGLAYMVNNEWLHVNVTVAKDNGLGLRADVMHYYLTEAANEIKELLTNELNQNQLKAKL